MQITKTANQVHKQKSKTQTRYTCKKWKIINPVHIQIKKIKKITGAHSKYKYNKPCVNQHSTMSGNRHTYKMLQF